MVAGLGGGTGGKHIVDEKQVFAFELFGMTHSECRCHVINTLLAVFVSLRRGVTAAVYVVDGQ